MGDSNLFSELISRNIVTVEDNHLKILRRIDISSYGSKAWAFTIQEIYKKGGSKFLYELGYSMGEDAAKEILGIVKPMQAYLTNKLKELENLIEITGFGIVEIKANKKVPVKVIVKQNHIIQYAKEMYGKESHICEFYMGIYNAFINVYYNKKLKLKESSCICKEQKECVFVI